MTEVIRLATPDDGPALARIYRPAVVERPTSFELDAPDAAEMGRRVARIAGRLPWLVFELDGDVVGYAYASLHRERAAYQWSVDVSAYVDSVVRRGGIGRALYGQLFEILVRQGYFNAYAGITLPNPASEGFHRAMGFIDVGVYHHVGYKLGAWHDVLWLERELQPRVDDPRPPRALGDAR